jgi:hypothetical protein
VALLRRLIIAIVLIGFVATAVMVARSLVSYEGLTTPPAHTPPTQEKTP